MTACRLDPADCRRLLDQADVGRVAFTDRAMPAIAAVPYRVDHDEILLSVPAGSRLAEATHDAVVAFQVDDLAHGWTVTVIGETRHLPRERSGPRGRGRPPGPGRLVVALSIDVLEGHCGLGTDAAPG